MSASDVTAREDKGLKQRLAACGAMRLVGSAFAVLALVVASASTGALPGVSEGPVAAWMVETASATCGLSGQVGIAFDAEGRAHVVSRDDCGVGGPRVVYAEPVDAGWQTHVVPTKSRSPVVGVSAGGEVGVAWHQDDPAALVYGRWTGGGFDGSTVDASGTDPLALAFDAVGRPVVVYETLADGQWAARREADGAWTRRQVLTEAEDGGGCGGDAALGPTGLLHLFYATCAGAVLATGPPTGPFTKTSLPFACTAASVAVDASDRAHLLCNRGGPVEYHAPAGPGWALAFRAPGDHGAVGLAVSPGDAPHVVYVSDPDGELDAGQVHHASPLGGRWVDEVVDHTSLWTDDVDVALDAHGAPGIALGRERTRGDGVVPCTQAFCTSQTLTQVARPLLARALPPPGALP